MGRAVHDVRGLTREVEGGVGKTGSGQRVGYDDGALWPQHPDQGVHSCRVDVYTVGDQFAAHPIGLGKRGEGAGGAMQQRSHGVETVGDVCNTKFDGLFGLLVGGIGMAHAHGNASVNKATNHGQGAR